jgi:hypothetical protein
MPQSFRIQVVHDRTAFLARDEALARLDLNDDFAPGPVNAAAR